MLICPYCARSYLTKSLYHRHLNACRQTLDEFQALGLHHETDRLPDEQVDGVLAVTVSDFDLAVVYAEDSQRFWISHASINEPSNAAIIEAIAL